jgi:hypothetical protein
MPNFPAYNRLPGLPDDLATLPVRTDDSAARFADAILMGYALRAPPGRQVPLGEMGGAELFTPTATTPRMPLPRIELDPGPPPIDCEWRRLAPWLPLECFPRSPKLPPPPPSPYLPDYLRPNRQPPKDR